MINRLTIAFLTAVAAFWLTGCGTSNPTVAAMGDEVISLKEFESSYAKNNGGWEKGKAASLEERQRFLDLLVKFRLKVKEARRIGLDKDPEVVAEISGYEQSLAQSYMLDKELVEPGVRRLYDRKQFMLRASHILLRLPENASPQDTLRVWNRAMELIGIAAKKSFDTLAMTASEDQSVSFNRGNLGFFSVGRMVPAFEDACYALEPGQMTQTPVRSPFGYHLIKLLDRQANRGAVQISHILVRGENPADTAWIRDTVSVIMAKLRAGVPFNTLVAEYSTDENSVMRGGDIGAYERDRLPQDLGDLLYATPKDSIAPPYFAPYGAHVFRVNGFTGIPAFSELERELKQVYQQLRYASDYANYTHRLKKQYQYTLHLPVVFKLHAQLDSTLTPSDSLWRTAIEPTLASELLISAGAQRLTVDTVLLRIEKAAEFRSMRLTPVNIDQMLERIGESVVLQEHANTAASRHPVFSELMKEYRDGILLYRIEQDEVWQKVVVNDTLLRAFHGEIQERFRWPDRVNFAEIFVTGDSLVQVALKRLNAGEEFLDVAEAMTMRAGYRERRGIWGLQAATHNNLSAQAMQMAVDSVTGPFRNGNGFSIMKVLGKEGARMKTFEEAGPELMSAYQEQASKQREQEWIASLRNRYGLTLNLDALKSAFSAEHEPTE
ncbi:MAG: peptidylprolyl isomerase [Bacteroidetes bacterium]|jgi:peptidyl-prolyl cis-trans isomerase SurA|nr:peptidylprolyl isomerase [Bacteroidota bacterium]